jgi:serine/threonine protein kinase/Tol biopolymer transport system component
VAAVFHEALEQDAAARAAYLDAACAADAALRAEVESLLAAHQATGGFIDGSPLEKLPASAVAALGNDVTKTAPDSNAAARSAALATGTRLGPYQIVGPLSAGGMGELFRALDTRLGRDVAIKVPFAADDPSKRQRFQREARAIAALNHPHICTVHDVGSESGFDYLVLELLQGESLAARLKRGGLPVDEAIPRALEIAGALARAHRDGIVHRDLKPGNVMLTPSGAKVLDFGLARIVRGETDAPRSPAGFHSAPLTDAGAVLGTLQYMAPEQLEGRVADTRADIFAFGATLYEMLTGQRAFDAASSPGVIAAILRGETPSLLAARPDLPPALDRIVRTCLAKDPEARFASLHDVAVALQWARDDANLPRRPDVVMISGRRRTALRVALATLAAALLTAVTIWALLSPRELPAQSVQRYEIVTPAASRLNVATTTPSLALSPDGRWISYVTDANLGSGGQLMVREAGDLTPRRVEGVPESREPAFSPDGRWLVYGVADLKKVPVTGGASVTLYDPPAVIRGPSWSDDGSIVFSTLGPETGLLRVSDEGGTVEELTRPDASNGEADHLFPSALPSGRGELFVIHSAGSEAPHVAVRDGKTGAIKRLVPGAAARYADGRIVYAANGTLYARSFDLERLELTGEPVIIAERVLMGVAGGAFFDVARNGTLVYVPASAASDPPRRLMWVDRSGHETPLGAPDLAYGSVRLSPEGDRVAAALRDEGRDIYTWDIVRGRLTPVTREAGEETNPVWTADGKELIYTSRESVGSVLSRRLADGSATARVLARFPLTTVATAVTSDGQFLLGNRSILGVWELFVMPLGRPDTVRTGIQKRANYPAASPDDRYIAFTSRESGLWQTYVRPFQRSEEARWQVSGTGGSNPVWRADGRELFYWQPRDATLGEGMSGGQLMAVPVDTTGPAFTWQTPRPLFSVEPYQMSGLHPFDVSRDGQRLLMIKNLGPPQESGGRIVVLLNALKR